MILWFSGTGNSRFVAERLAARLNQPLREMKPGIVSTPLDIAGDDDKIIWVCPVYSWGIPPYVRSIIKKINFGSRSEALTHHLVLTCGDDCGLAAEMWRADLRKRGWKDACAYTVVMPNNYVCMKGFDVDPKEIEERKLSEAPSRIDDIASRISSFHPESGKKETDVIRGRFAWIKTRIIYPWFIRNAMSPKEFHSTDSCISCGKCAAKCPLDNITMLPVNTAASRTKKRPSWGDNCAGCLACYHVCPRHAVMYGKSTRDKGQYMNKL